MPRQRKLRRFWGRAKRSAWARALLSGQMALWAFARRLFPAITLAQHGKDAIRRFGPRERRSRKSKQASGVKREVACLGGADGTNQRHPLDSHLPLARKRIHQPGNHNGCANEQHEGPRGVQQAASGRLLRQAPQRDGDQQCECDHAREMAQMERRAGHQSLRSRAIPQASSTASKFTIPAAATKRVP